MENPTPMVEKVPGVLSKLECMNPGGSHKTRAARYIVRSAIAAGEVRPGITALIEKTGGNFGLGLALECERHGVGLELVLVEPSGCSMRHDHHSEHAMEGIAVGVAILDAAARYKSENPDRQVVTVVYDEGAGTSDPT